MAVEGVSFMILLGFVAFLARGTLGQVKASSAEAPASSACNGIFLSYSYKGGNPITPMDPANQPYRFTSTVRVQNHGRTELKSWQVFVGFMHDEYLVSASNAVLADGTGLPADVRNGTIFSGYPATDLKTAIETAGDSSQTSVEIDLVGTQFGVPSSKIPLPSNISLVNDGYRCPMTTTEGSIMFVCCVKDATATSNVSVAEPFLPRGSGDLTIMYDVIKTFDSNYWAQVMIENHNPLGRLDNWKLGWEWMRGEFIYAMKGAYPDVVDSSECIFGDQGVFYSNMDFSNVLSCQKKPTIIDLPPNMYNDTTFGLKPSCCRNGTVLPPSMDPSKSKSAFQLQVYKMPPDLNRSVLTPPQNWQINGTLNPNYKCAPPVRVSPSEFPDSSGLPVNSTAVASWQIVCNITRPKGISPKCCVSFSAYYNESVIPCKTCACGCSSNTARTCNASASAMLLPPDALLVPFDNRTSMSLAWANLKHLEAPNPMPCGDNCGVSINWHVYTDYTKGWSARITIFNWDEVAFADWFAAVELDRAAAGFQDMYSFNASSLTGVNNTIIMQGHPGLNYLVAETNGSDPKRDPRVPGKQQSVISFTKKLTPAINVAGGDGFPTKVYFNGEECALPSELPSGARHLLAPSVPFLLLVAALVFMREHLVIG